MNFTVNKVVVVLVVSVLSFSLFPETVALKLIKIIVPEYVYLNKPVELECRYVLENDEKLYRVQWYKDNEEFYRFDQKSNPRQFTYPIDEIKVDKSQSNEKKVVLKNVNLKMRGIYKCEVSAEAPSFSTVFEEAQMNVIALPKEGPHIHGQEKTYQIGDMINLTCTSGKSYPPAKLKWFINNQEVQSDLETVHDRGGLTTTSSRVSIKAGPEHFINGHIQIRCQATIAVANHSVINLPIQHNKATELTSTKLNYQKDALISVKGNTLKVVPSVLLSLVMLSLCTLFYDIT